MKPHEDRAARKQHDRQVRHESTKKEYRDVALKALLQHRHGREYIWWLLELSQIGDNAFASNALFTSFNCGQQNVGQQILAHMLEVDPNGYLELLKERNDEQAMVNPDGPVEQYGDEA